MTTRLPTILFILLTIALGTIQNTSAAEPSARPNILFIIFDDWGWQHAGAYGCTWVKTPNFDRIAREGVLFKNAFTSNPKCSPCRGISTVVLSPRAQAGGLGMPVPGETFFVVVAEERTVRFPLPPAASADSLPLLLTR